MKVITFKEEEAYSVDKIPADPDSFFENFINIFSSYNFLIGSPLTIDEIGPRENLKTTFQFVGMIFLNYNCTIRFEIESSKLTVFAQTIIEFTMRRTVQMKSGTKMYNKIFRDVMERNVKKAVGEAFESKKKEIESGTKDVDPLKHLKLKFVNGEISEEEYQRKKKILEE